MASQSTYVFILGYKRTRVNRAALMELCVIILFVESPSYKKNFFLQHFDVDKS